MNNTKQLTEKEQSSVAILIRLGDSKELAIDTVIKGRKSEAMKSAQLNDYSSIND